MQLDELIEEVETGKGERKGTSSWDVPQHNSWGVTNTQ
jgi:hypothetical protein